MLARIRALKKDQRIDDATALSEEGFKRVAGLDSESLLRLSETELFAKVLQAEPVHAVREKMSFLIAILREAGDLAVVQGRDEESREYYLKGLHLLLGILARGDAYEVPEFVPKVEEFVSALADSDLPGQTNALLMEHYERTGQFGKAEDALFSIVDADPENVPAIEFGILFYERLRRQNDLRLEEGNLPRDELESGLKELRARSVQR